MVPEVSVIVPNYNHARYLKQRIGSILGQSFRNIEIIILDDLSTDDSRDVIEQYRSNEYVSHIEYNQKNSGSTFAQWEKGLLLTRGEWVWIAESDDYAAPEFLETLLKLAKQHDNIGIAFCNSHWVDHNSEIKESQSLYPNSFYHNGIDEARQMCVHCTIQNVSATLLKRAYAVEAIKGLSRYKACGDWIFYTRILQRSNIVYTNQKLNYFRWYHANVSNTNKARLWSLEGVQVLENVDYKLVKFTWPAYFNIIRRWCYKAMRLGFKDSLQAWGSIFKATVSFVLS